MTESELTKMALDHDINLALAVSHFSESIVEIGKELAIMKDDELKLYRYVKNPDSDGSSRGCFNNWREYAHYRLGKVSVSTMYEFLAAESLTHGAKPMPAKAVEKLGIKKAAQIARLPEGKRTKKFLKRVEEVSVAATKALVDEVLEDDVPEGERKVRLVPLTIALPQDTIDLINEVERDGIYMEAIRDGDMTRTLRAKLWHAVFVSFKVENQEELKAAAFYREYQRTHANQEKVVAQPVN